MNLRKYRTYDGKPYEGGEAEAEGQNASESAPLQADISAEKLDEYMGMDDDARWRLLVSKVAEAKRAGTMTDADLDTFAESCRAVLEPDQYSRMLEMIAAIKG